MALQAVSGFGCLVRESWGSGETGWVGLSPTGNRRPQHLIHFSGAGAQELLWPAYHFAKMLTPTASLPLHLQKVIIIVIMSH